MDKEAIEKIQELCKPLVVNIKGEEYALNWSGDVIHIRPDVEYPACIKLYSLDALVQMVKTEALSLYEGTIYVMADAHDRVSCFLQPDYGLRCYRQYLYEVSAKDVPGWREEDTMQFEQALIAVRTRFQQNADSEYLLRLLSEITNGAKVTFADNGVATTVVTSKGIALQGSEAIRPIITLKPYRTFQEIDQPASAFHIRIGERGIKFIEADGGMWKLTARRTITDYLKEDFSGEIEDGRVVVML